MLVEVDVAAGGGDVTGDGDVSVVGSGNVVVVVDGGCDCGGGE